MTEPTFDREGYPTEETLQALREWPMETAAAGLDFLSACWKDGYMAESGLAKDVLPPAEIETICADDDERVLRLPTGGWSGNEDAVNAFMESLAATMTWCLHARGGLWIFKYPEVKA